MRKELYQYTTQVQIILLQEYFKNHNIDFYSFMAFTPLVENEFKNTEWDLREHIDTEKFYGLYSDINSMAQKLNSLITYTLNYFKIIISSYTFPYSYLVTTSSKLLILKYYFCF